MTQRPSHDDVLQFWFGDAPPYRVRPEWFQKNEAFDREIERRFGTLIQAALAHQIDDWASAPDTALARVIVLDQFTRNVFRNRAESFAGDPQALDASREMLARGFDLCLDPLQRVFVYLPLEHSEDRATQDESVRQFEALDVAQTPQHALWLDYARRHRDIVARFGRFPHRNAVLGRASTEEERTFLTEPGSAF